MFVFIGRMRVSSEYTEALGGGAGRGVREGDVSEHVHVMWDIRAGMLGVYVSSSLCMLFPNGVEGLALAFFFFISVSLVIHIGRCDRSHPRANLIVHASQIQSGEGVSKDRECLILLPPTDLFPENPGIKWEASCGRVCRDISCLNRWPWGQGQEQAEVIGFPLQCSMKAAW